jgi:hypothetical protein
LPFFFLCVLCGEKSFSGTEQRWGVYFSQLTHFTEEYNMHSIRRITLTGIFIMIIASSILQIRAQTGKSIMGVFEGITPCGSPDDRPLPQIPADAECEMMIWKVTFYQNPETAEPTTYQLDAAYGMSQPNTTGIKGGGIPVHREGAWHITQGAAHNPDAVVYELSSEPAPAGYLIKMDDNILHVLSPEKRLMVGHGAWSYTLNRTDEHVPAAFNTSVDPTTLTASSPEIPEQVVVDQDFEGRMLCIDLTYEFTKFPPSPSCIKLKMRLTLHRDAATGLPTSYFLLGTETTREGTWTESRGTAADPNGIVYRLALDTPERFIAFLSADENHLFLLDENLNLVVGDALWSFTLSRTDFISR